MTAGAKLSETGSGNRRDRGKSHGKRGI